MVAKFGKFSLLALAAAGLCQSAVMEGGEGGGGVATAPAADKNKAEEKKKPEIIKAPAPTPINDFVVMSPQIFHFKTETLRNAEGKEIGKGKKHPSVEIYLPVPKDTKLAEFLLAPDFTEVEVDGKPQKVVNKEKELIMQAVTDQIYRIARMQINEKREKNAGEQITPASLNYDKLDWTAIANMPKSERGAYVPEEEDIKAFLASYLELMPELANKSKEKIENHVLCFQTGFKKQRAQKEILEMFRDALNIYVASAGENNVEEHADVIEYFSNKLERMLKSEEKITMDDL